jgi:hypothetical protein
MIASAKGLDPSFWGYDPIKLVLSKRVGPDTTKHTVVYEVSEPRHEVPSIIVRLDGEEHVISIEFY